MNLPDQLQVLVVDSQPTMRAQLRSMLSSIGVESTDFAVSAATALKSLREKRFDLILCEYNLGEGQDGQQLLEDLRANRILPPETVFVMISSEHDMERVASAAELKLNDYILKPLNAESLRVRLLRAFKRRAAFMPAWKRMKVGDTTGALEYCRSAAEEHPQYRIDLMRLQAELQASMGQVDEAEALYRQINDTQPIPWAALGVARMLALKKDFAEAERLLIELTEHNLKFIEAYDLLAEVQERTGNSTDACETLRKATALSPYRTGRLRTLGDLFLQTGNHVEAAQVLGDVVRKSRYSAFRDPEDHVRLVQAQLANDQLSEARATTADLNRSLGRQPKGDLCTNLCTALMYVHVGDTESAQATLSDTLRDNAEVRGLSPTLRQDLATVCFDHQLEEMGSEMVMDLLRTAEDEQAVERTRAMLRARDQTQLVQQIDARLQAEVKALVTAGAQKAYAGDYDGAVAEMLNAARKMPGNPHVLFNAALALLRHIEHRGWNEGFAAQARNLIQRTRRLAPQNPRLAAMTELMERLKKRHETPPASTPARSTPA